MSGTSNNIYMDIYMFWLQIENETSIDIAEVCCGKISQVVNVNFDLFVLNKIT